MTLKNKDGSGNWPDKRHIGWSVATAGPVELYEDYLTVSSTYFEGEVLPTAFRMILKDIDDEGRAWVYHDRYGVMKLPKELLVAWDR